MAMATICAYPSSKYALPYYKCVLWCFEQSPCIDIPIPDSYHHNANFSPTISFFVNNIIACCIVHGRQYLNEKQQCKLCEASSGSIVKEKIYTRKELVMIETSIVDFHKRFYIPAIQKLAFHISLVPIIGTHNCVNKRREALNRLEAYQDVFCHQYYS